MFILLFWLGFLVKSKREPLRGNVWSWSRSCPWQLSTCFACAGCRCRCLQFLIALCALWTLVSWRFGSLPHRY